MGIGFMICPMQILNTKEQVIEFFAAGSITALAGQLGITKQTWYNWADELKPHQVDQVTGAAVRLGIWPEGRRTAA